MRGQDTVLCIQDGTDLNFATRPGCEGLGIIGRNQTAAKTLGLHLHLTLAVSGAGLPLGVLRCGFDAPPPGEASPEQDPENGDEASSGNADTEPDADDSARKTRCWLDGLHDVAEAASHLPRKTRVLSVMDREADFFELFDAQRRIGRVEVHYRGLTLPSTVEGLAPVTLWAVHVRETAPPEGEKPIEWFLLTSVRVDGIEAALETIEHYLRRWRVEDFFRVLKSGCRAEHLGFHSAERLERALTIQAVIAWRLMLMTLLGREVPECDAELLFSDIELRFLTDYAADAA